ncbi:MAG: GCN5-related N-acetyltransferase [Tardiphaga sp.]|jgi:ribosomal protein S18 acetylase RimI-like enzyme|uniref:GNAT family acetyltransferase n=1 Tax=Tardiphaga sp. TaxID=1926292 RepID=UPI00260DC67E|nr:GNAT family acetyltransferase [Tardiphaga sp.]MDB5500797.1 GCN5-related N-acetyltransferase [Tardiphaga sp.]
MSAALQIAPLADADIPAVIALWRRCGLVRPWNDPEADIALARQNANADVLLGRAGDVIAASVLVGHDGHRGWVYYVSVDPDHQRQNFGGAIMTAAEDWLRARGIEKLQLMVRGDNTQVQAFYESIGFGEQKRIVYAKWLDGRELTP